MAKDKKKKKKDKKQKSSMAETAVKNLKAFGDNRLIAEVVSSALIGTAAALKDSKKARQLAAHAGDELEALAKGSAERGNAMWKLALEVGKRALDTLVNEEPAKAPKASRAPKAPKAPKVTKRAKAPTAPKAAKRANAPTAPKAQPNRSKAGRKPKA